jgi:hypothetical protein
VLGGAVCCAAALPGRAEAQYVPGQFPTGVPGYGEELGVTVVSRLRPLYEEPGLRLGDFLVHGGLNQSVGYNSNVLGLSGGAGSPVIETNPTLSVNSGWGRDALGASVSVDDFRYLSAPSQDRTDWTVALGGGYTIGRSNLTLAYAHLQLHESPTSIGAPPSTTPIPYTVDDMRASYRFGLGRLEVTPNLDVSLWRYGTTTVGGVAENEDFRDADEIRAGAALRYALTGGTALILTMQGIRSEFIHGQPGEPSLSSTSALALGGIDYQYDGVWRYQALIGVEVREFDAAQFATRTAPIARAAVIWTPTELTTVTATLLRTIEDPVQVGTSGFTYTAAGLEVDHEYLRNVLLNARSGLERVAYLQNGGVQNAFYVGAGATWLINRHLRLTGTYTYTTLTSLSAQSLGSAPVGGAINSAYSQNLFLVTLHVGL